MKKLYYSLIILLIAVIGLVFPKAKASSGFDDLASYIGFLEDYEIDDNGDIIGAWVYLYESSLPDGSYPVYWFFSPDYFQPDIITYAAQLKGKFYIWNNFDKRGDLYEGSWWLLTEYTGVSSDDAFEYGYAVGYGHGYNDGLGHGEQIGYDNGYGVGYDEGFGDGFDVGYDDGKLQGWNDGYDDGYSDGREQVLNSIENMEILYQDIVLPNGVKDEIVNNEILVDRVGMVVFDGSEAWTTQSFGDIEPYSTISFRLTFPTAYTGGGKHFICNILTYGDIWNNDIANRINLTGVSVQIRISKADLVPYGYNDSMTNQQKVNAFKQWLAAQKAAGEPLTVWYQYAEPKQYDLIPLLINEDGSFKDGYNTGYNEGRVHVQKENKSLLSVIPTTIGSIWLVISDFLSFEVFGLNLWAILMMFAGFSLLVLIIKMVI